MFMYTRVLIDGMSSWAKPEGMTKKEFTKQKQKLEDLYNELCIMTYRYDTIMHESLKIKEKLGVVHARPAGQVIC